MAVEAENLTEAEQTAPAHLQHLWEYTSGVILH